MAVTRGSWRLDEALETLAFYWDLVAKILIRKYGDVFLKPIW